MEKTQEWSIPGLYQSQSDHVIKGKENSETDRQEVLAKTTKERILFNTAPAQLWLN